MKRSESALVYAVTGVLVVIVLVAVLFGGGPPATGDQSGEVADDSEFVDLTDRVAEQGGDPVSAEPDLENEMGVGEEEHGEVLAPLHRPAPDLRAVLGDFEVSERPDGAQFRLVVVQSGDSFSGLVERWTGSLERSTEVEAMNETVVPDRLRSGQVLVMPWVDDEELLDAYLDRAERRLAGGAGGGSTSGTAASSAPSPSVGSLATATTYTVQPGDSLWRIAERRVGPGRASAYIESILAANPTIGDASKVRHGVTIQLPPAD